MFDFLLDVGNYEDRKVDRSEFEWGFISTARVSDGSQPFETAVQHPDYNDGSMVIVEAYATKALAQEGHKKWVEIMTAKKLPGSLTDCANSMIAQAFGSTQVFNRKEKSTNA